MRLDLVKRWGVSRRWRYRPGSRERNPLCGFRLPALIPDARRSRGCYVRRPPVGRTIPEPGTGLPPSFRGAKVKQAERRPFCPTISRSETDPALSRDGLRAFAAFELRPRAAWRLHTLALPTGEARGVARLSF